MLIVTISRTSRHFSLVDARSRSQLHMAGAFIIFSDCLVFTRAVSARAIKPGFCKGLEE